MQDWLGTSRQTIAPLQVYRATAQTSPQSPMCYCLNPACLSPQNPDSLECCQTCGAKLALGDRYWALKPLGQGGFGKTFLATDHAQPAHPRCVIKQFLPPQQGSGHRERASALFRQEALRLQELGHHPQIPALLDALEQAGQPYLVQTFIDGPNLAQVLADEGAWSEAQILQLLGELLPILEFMHAHQVIHRDIKPANIIRQSADQTLFLVDLGAAKYATGTALAQTGTVIGSAEYTAPEQARGKAVFASDLYSLGVTCIHLLTEMSPFDLFDNANGRWVWRAYLKGPLTNMPLGRILDKMLQAATNQRYQSIQTLQLDLAALHSPERRFLRTLPSEQPPVDRLRRAAQPESLLQERRAAPQFSVLPGGAIVPLQPAASRRSITSTQTAGVVGLTLLALFPISLWVLSGGQHEVRLFPPSRQSSPPAIAPRQSISALPNLRPQFTQPVQPVRTLRVAGGLTSLALSPKGQFLASGGLGAIRLWQLDDRNWHRTFLAPAVWIGAVAISPDGHTLVSTTDKGEIQLRDLPSGKLLRSLNDLTKAIAISPDGQTLASGSSGPDTSIKLWHLRRGTLSHTLPGHQGTVSQVVFSPDGQTLASSSYDGTIRLWQRSDGKLLQLLHENPPAGPLTWIESVAISPDGQTLIAGVSDTIQLWELHTGKLLLTLSTGQEAPSTVLNRVTMTAISPNGQVIANGTASGTLQLWNRHTGRLLRSVRAHGTQINALIFSADQKTLISGSNDGAIKFWLTEQLLSE